MTSHRAELYGIYGILFALLRLEQHHKLQSGGNLHIACDSQSALDNSFAHSKRAPVSTNNFDIIWAIYQLRQQIKTTITYEHVYGHQDEKNRKLTRLERINCEMDHAASKHRIYIEGNPQYKCSQIYLHKFWTISIKNKIIS